MQRTLSNKADSSTLNSTVASLTASISNNLATTNAALAAKADTATLTSSVNSTNSSLAAKAEFATLTSSVRLQTAGAGISTVYVNKNIRTIYISSDSLLQVLLYVDPFSPSDIINNNRQLSLYLSTYETQIYVNAQINNLVNGSPALLNTLKELACSIHNGAPFSATMKNLISTKQPSITTATD